MFWLNSRDEDAAGVGDVWTVLRAMFWISYVIWAAWKRHESEGVLTCTTIQFGAAFSVTMCRIKSLMCCSRSNRKS
jgi:hypothetical protein